MKKNDDTENKLIRPKINIPINPNENPLQLDKNAFILGLLTNHPDLYIKDDNHFGINFKKNIKEEHKKALETLEKGLINRFRFVQVEPNKCYFVEECDTKTGQVLNTMLYLNKNVKKEDLPIIKDIIQNHNISHVATENKETDLLYKNNQQVLQELIKKNQNSHLNLNNLNQNKILPVLVSPHTGTVFNQFGYILSGMSLLMVHQILSKNEQEKQHKLRNFINQIRLFKRKIKHKLDLDDDDEDEQNDLKSKGKKNSVDEQEFLNLLEHNASEMAKNMLHAMVNLIEQVKENVTEKEYLYPNLQHMDFKGIKDIFNAINPDSDFGQQFSYFTQPTNALAFMLRDSLKNDGNYNLLENQYHHVEKEMDKVSLNQNNKYHSRLKNTLAIE